jgi:predicted class III extradiol MEMO1 family dioxygenase
MKDSENANNVGVDFEKLRMDIADEILQQKEDKSVAMAIAKTDPSFIRYVSMESQHDLDIAREIIKNNPETASQYLDEQFVNYIKEKESKEKEQKNEPQDNTIRMSRNAESISSLISEYKSKEARRFSSGAASVSFDNLGDSIEREIRKNANDKSVAIAIAKSDPYFIKYVSEELQSDMDVVREIVKNNPENASKYVKEELVEKIKKEEEQKKLEFEKQKGQLDSNSPLVDAVKNSYEQDKGMGL